MSGALGLSNDVQRSRDRKPLKMPSVADTRMTRIGLLFPGAPAVPEMIDLSRRAEAAGYDSVWVAETRLTRDAIVPLAAIAGRTERIRLGSGIIPVPTRNPVTIALSFISLEEMAPGRIIMGLGAGSPMVLAPQGIAFEKPLTRLREYCEVIPHLIRGEEVSYDGTAVRLQRARVEDVISSRAAGGSRTRIPLWLGVTGPRSLEYAGEVADGVMLNGCLGTDYVERACGHIGRGARRAGRTRDDVEIAMALWVAPHEDSTTGKRIAARALALYLSLFPNIARETGLAEKVTNRVREEFYARGVEAATELIGDDIVDRQAVAGTPEECRSRLHAYRSAGIQLPVLAPLEGTMDLAIETLR
jgi:5,10-methylenetetrahydromethanopterin reductase